MWHFVGNWAIPASVTMATTNRIRQCGKQAVIAGNGDAEGYARWQANLSRLAAMPEAELAGYDIARLNLFCAAGLPGTQGVNPDACIAKLEDWTKYIGRNIARWWPDFLRTPQDGEDSPGKFRMMAVATLLQRQLGVHYNLPFTEGDYDGRDSRNLFLHGLLSGCGGTCVTLPVLYIAIGRWLGYPLFLVKSRCHYFARWEEAGEERFNAECAGGGFASYSDEYYQTWRCRSLMQRFKAVLSCGILHAGRNLPISCLNVGTACDHLRIGEALEAYYHAYQMAPYDGGIRGHWIVASMMYRTLQEAMREADRKGTNMIPIPEMRYPEPRDANEAWASARPRDFRSHTEDSSKKGRDNAEMAA